MSNNGIPPLNDWQDDNYPVIYDEGNSKSYYVKTGNKVEITGGSSSYLVYSALLTQSGTDAPVATVLQNTLGGTVVWTRNSTGQYLGTLAGAFTLNKTVVPPFDSGNPGGAVNIPIANSLPNSFYYNITTLASADTVQISVYDDTYTSVDLSTALAGWDTKIFIEIRVYS